MIKNGKYFLPPDDERRDFKDLFAYIAAAGVGRPVDPDGFPTGPWTPDLLAEAISQIEANRTGIELRTVQLWFQNNDRGISADNIRWLARVWGCDDPEATSAWQAELTAAQVRLAARRRQQRQSTTANAAPPPTDEDATAPFLPDMPRSDNRVGQIASLTDRRLSIARVSESIFSRKSQLELPALVFAGAIALQFLSLFLGIHSVTYVRDDGIVKQVGFLWSPNWTFLFILFLPLFLAIAVDLVVFWKTEGRAELLELHGCRKQLDHWTRKLDSSSYTFWALFLLCIVFAGVFQWVDVRLLPLLGYEGDHAIDWGSLALADPEAIGIPEQIVFTALAYLYMSICFYIFFSGLLLLYAIAHDFWEIQKAASSPESLHTSQAIKKIGKRIMRAICRCTIMGLLMAITMKLQALYITTNASNVPHWLMMDVLSLWPAYDRSIEWGEYDVPTAYTSLVVGLVPCSVFLYAAVRIGRRSSCAISRVTMAMPILSLSVAYLSIGAFAGFTVLLIFGILFATYSLFDPDYRALHTPTDGVRNV